jgi:uncharacterized integral membrane protein
MKIIKNSFILFNVFILILIVINHEIFCFSMFAARWHWYPVEVCKLVQRKSNEKAAVTVLIGGQ